MQKKEIEKKEKQEENWRFFDGDYLKGNGGTNKTNKKTCGQQSNRS